MSNGTMLDYLVDYLHNSVESIEDAFEVYAIDIDDQPSLELEIYTVLDKCSNCQSWQYVCSIDAEGYCEYCA